MGLTKLKQIFSSRRSRSSKDPSGPDNDRPRPRQQSTSASSKSPGSTSCNIPVEPHGVSIPNLIERSAHSGSQPIQAHPPDDLSKVSSPTPEDSHTPVHELWNVAYEKLQDEDKDLVADYEAKLCGDLDAGPSSPLSGEVGMRNRMDTILRGKMDEINRDAWKLKFRSSEVQVGELVKPVLGVVDWANDYITNAVSANAYASLAWGGVSLLLPLFLNPSEQAASMAKGLEHIASLIVQSRMWEDLYFRRYESNNGQQVSSPPSHVAYKDTLEMLYRQILRFQVSSYCYYANTGAVRLGRDVVKWDEWDALLDKIKEQERVFSAVQSSWRDMKFDEECSAAEQRHQEAVRCWQAIGTDTSGLLKAVQDAQKEKNRDGFLHWLCAIDPSGMYNTARDQHMSGTSAWLTGSSEDSESVSREESEALPSEMFDIWKQAPSSLLWLHGKAGSGKSILSSSVVKHLKGQCSSDPGSVIAYFFYSFSNQEIQSVTGMLASLVKQLYANRPDTPHPIKRLVEYQKKGERPDTETLEAALIATTRGFSAVFIVIDALDECPSVNGERKKLLGSLSRVIAEMPGNVHVFCTSRAEPDIKTAMSTVLSPPSRAAIDLTARREGLDHDISLYIDSTFASADYSSWPDDLKAEAKRSLIENADGMFQYVVCQFEALQELASVAHIREALQNLPVGLDATYDRLLQNIDGRFETQVVSLLKWLASSNGLIGLEELAEIFILHPERTVAIDTAERLFHSEDVLKYISSLIVIEMDRVPKIPCVRLAHFTIKEYLTSSRIAEGPAKRFSFSETDAHQHIAHTCLAYLLHVAHCSNDMDPEYFDEWILMKYASPNWALHLEMVPREAWLPEVERLALHALAIRSKSMYKMVVDAAFGIKRTRSLETRWYFGSDLEYHRWYNRPLAYTAWRGLFQLTDMLLCAGLGTNGYLTQNDLDVALVEAAFGGDTKVVQLLLDKGANVNAEDQDCGSALYMAAYEGNVPVLQLLLDSGAEVNAQHNELGSASQVAASRYHLHAWQLLVERGADNEWPTKGTDCDFMWDMPYFRVWDRNEAFECLQFMLDNGANVNGPGGSHETPLHMAARRLGWLNKNFHLLLERGADVNAPGGTYGYPLQAACRDTQVNTADIEILLAKGADVNAQGGEYGNALQAACSCDQRRYSELERCSVVSLLLDRGAGVNIVGGIYGTALQAACTDEYSDEPSLVEILLEQGADVNILAGMYGNALQAACRRGTSRTVKLLLSRGADVNAQGGKCGSALQAAVLWGYQFPSLTVEKKSKLEMVSLLLTHGAEVNTKGGEYGTVLMAACIGGDVDVVRLLLNQGAEVNAKEGQYGTALQAVCYMGFIDIALLLIEHGAEINAQGGEYGTALQAVCYRGFIDIAQLLIEHGAEINAQGGRYETALQAACVNRHLDTARLLIEHGADANVQGGELVTAWHAATTCERPYTCDLSVTLIQLLLEHGVDVNDTRGRRYPDALRAVLDLDEYSAKIEVARFLLDRGANINLEAGTHALPLQVACAKDGSFLDVEGVVSFLLEYCPSVDINAASGKFGFALQAAAYSGQTGSIKMLLDRGAHINARGGKYGSALNAAAVMGFWHIVEVLLEKGAKPDSQQLPEPDEEWLARIREEDGPVAVERYRRLWEVQRSKKSVV